MSIIIISGTWTYTYTRVFWCFGFVCVWACLCRERRRRRRRSSLLLLLVVVLTSYPLLLFVFFCFCNQTITTINNKASAWAMNPNGTTPLWSQVCKNYFTLRKTKRELFKQEDEIVSYISKNSKKYGFDFIITRPGSLIYDKQSQTKLAASKSVSLMFF